MGFGAFWASSSTQNIKILCNLMNIVTVVLDIHRSWHSCIIPGGCKSKHNANVRIPKQETNTPSLKSDCTLPLHTTESCYSPYSASIVGHTAMRIEYKLAETSNNHIEQMLKRMITKSFHCEQEQNAEEIAIGAVRGDMLMEKLHQAVTLTLPQSIHYRWLQRD